MIFTLLILTKYHFSLPENILQLTKNKKKNKIKKLGLIMQSGEILYFNLV